MIPAWTPPVPWPEWMLRTLHRRYTGVQLRRYGRYYVLQLRAGHLDARCFYGESAQDLIRDAYVEAKR